MDDITQYIAAMTLGTFSLPLALGLAWVSLRLLFDAMPAAQRVRALAAAKPALVGRESGRRAA